MIDCLCPRRHLYNYSSGLWPENYHEPRLGNVLYYISCIWFSVVVVFFFSFFFSLFFLNIFLHVKSPPFRIDLLATSFRPSFASFLGYILLCLKAERLLPFPR